MTVRPIVALGNPVLRNKARKVSRFDEAIRTLVQDMIETMRDAPGVGLAAPQIGVPLQIAVVEAEKDEVHVMVNPEIVKTRGRARPGRGVPLRPRLLGQGQARREGHRQGARRPRQRGPHHGRRRAARAGAPARDRPPQRDGVRRSAGQPGRSATDPSARAQALRPTSPPSPSDRLRPARATAERARSRDGGRLADLAGVGWAGCWPPAVARVSRTRRPRRSASPPTATPVPPPTPNVAATATARAQLQSLRMPTTEPPTLDPALATDHASVQVAIQLFEGLTEIDEAGQPAPLGAEKWEVADDGRTFTFTLRADRLWSDGSPGHRGRLRLGLAARHRPAHGLRLRGPLLPDQERLPHPQRAPRPGPARRHGARREDAGGQPGGAAGALPPPDVAGDVRAAQEGGAGTVRRPLDAAREHRRQRSVPPRSSGSTTSSSCWIAARPIRAPTA